MGAGIGRVLGVDRIEQQARGQLPLSNRGWRTVVSPA